MSDVTLIVQNLVDQDTQKLDFEAEKSNLGGVSPDPSGNEHTCVVMYSYDYELCTKQGYFTLGVVWVIADKGNYIKISNYASDMKTYYSSKLTMFPKYFIPSVCSGTGYDSTNTLNIIAALWGGGDNGGNNSSHKIRLGDVKDILNSLIENNQLNNITCNDSTFGDTWKGQKKTLTLLYSYNTASVEQLVFKTYLDGDTFSITPP